LSFSLSRFSLCRSLPTAILLLATFGGIQTRATIQYEISLARPAEHLFHVTMTIPDVHDELVVQIPAWNALYQIRDFSSRIQQLTAESGGQSLPIEKIDKLSWRTRAEGTVTLRYAVFWDSPGPFSSQLNEEHAFINPAMVFLYPIDRRNDALSLKFRDVPANWQVATALASSGARELRVPNVVTVEASSYDAFVDAPIEVGEFKFFRIGGIDPPVEVAIHGDNWKQSDVESTLRKICKYEIDLMGGAPFDHYLFILHIGKAAAGSGGGMEHASGTAIALGSPQQLASLAAHEFFHLWNVKRIRPASLEPIDYTREQYTRALWFAEGVTNTVGDYTLVRTGLWTRQDFYGDLAQQITELESRPASHWQSAEQSSLDAWLEKYPYYNGPDFSVSYYTKGQVLGVLLDILIRDRTKNQRSLDDVLRKMNEDFALKGKPYRDSLDIRLTAESVAGASFEDFFRQYVAAAEPLPYADILAKAGLLLDQQEIVRAELGFTIERDASGKSIIRSITPGSAAERSGLRVGDEIESWNSEAPPRRTDGWLRNRKPGDLLHLQVRRTDHSNNDQPLDLSLPLGGRTENIFVINEDTHASPQSKSIRESLLHASPVPASR